MVVFIEEHRVATLTEEKAMTIRSYYKVYNKTDGSVVKEHVYHSDALRHATSLGEDFSVDVTIREEWN